MTPEVRSINYLREGEREEKKVKRKKPFLKTILLRGRAIHLGRVKLRRSVALRQSFPRKGEPRDAG